MKDKMGSQPQSAVLATDLDGTFIPLEGEEENRRDLQMLVATLAAHNVIWSTLRDVTSNR